MDEILQLLAENQKNIDKPAVWVFSELIVCLDCGTTEFTVPKSELRQVAKVIPPRQVSLP